MAFREQGYARSNKQRYYRSYFRYHLYEDRAVRALPSVEQPTGVEIYTTDGVFIKQMVIGRRGTVVPQHAHAWDHTSMLAFGSVAVWRDGIFDRVYEAPSAIFIRAGVKHTFHSLIDNTIIYCIHNLHGEQAVKILEEHQLTGEV